MTLLGSVQTTSLLVVLIEMQVPIICLMRKLAKTSGVHDFVVLLETGMSVNEFCGLTRKDLDFKNRSIRVDHQLIRERGGNFTVPPFP